MKLGKHGQFLVDFVSAYINDEMERQVFDMDYSGYVIEHFPTFETETPRFAAKFARTIDRTYSFGEALSNDSFRESMAYALDEFYGVIEPPDIW